MLKLLGNGNQKPQAMARTLPLREKNLRLTQPRTRAQLPAGLPDTKTTPTEVAELTEVVLFRNREPAQTGRAVDDMRGKSARGICSKESLE